MNQRPFRFGVVAARAGSGPAWLDLARGVEARGFDTLLLPDRHGAVLAPFAALTAAAVATRTLRVGTFVLANGLRNPALLAAECATLDFLSGGRLELGLGTGVSEDDFRRANVPFERPGARITHLAETLQTVKSLWASAEGNPTNQASWASRYPAVVQQPRPPILIAGAGPRLLALAAHEADIVAFGVRGDATEAELAAKIALVRKEAGERFEALELSLNLLAVVGDAVAPGTRERIRAVFHAELDELARAGSPFILSGSPSDMAAQLEGLRARLSVSYITVPGDQLEAFGPVVERLAGR